MTNWLEHLAAYLQAGGLSLTAGTNLFTAEIPTTFNPATLAVVLTPTGGQADVPGLPISRPRVQILTRCTTHATAWQTALAIFVFLNKTGPFIWGASGYTYVQWIKATSPPAVLGRDENKAWRCVATYELELGTLS